MSSWWDRVADLVDQARALPVGEREAFLDSACGDDDTLRRDVSAVLGATPPESFLEPMESALPPGTELGEFTLLRLIGRGGMGVVYLARQRGLREAAALGERLAAVKVLPPERALDKVSYERFLREAEAATSLQHPGLVAVLASGESDGTLWYAMPFVEGHDLHVELDRQRALLAGQPAAGELILPPFGAERYITAAVEAMAAVADAVDHAHRRRVIHRDLKPRNLLLDRDGSIKITDFGVAKFLSMETLTLTDQHIGTPHYMSPEQARAIQNPVDERTDIYSMGVVLFELLSLKHHVRGRSVNEIIRNIASGETLRLDEAAPRTPRDLVIICGKALATRPADRYPSAAAFAADLRCVLHREAISARPPSRWQRLRSWGRRHPVRVVSAALVLLAVLGGMWWSEFRAEAERAADWTRRVEAALALSDWRGDEAVAADARAAVADMRARGAVPYELAELVGQFDARLAQDLAERVERARQLIARGKGGELPDTGGGEPYIAPPSPPVIVEGLLEASRGLTLHPEDSALSALTLFAVDLRLELDASAPAHAAASGPARAWALRRDPVDDSLGARRALGELPLSVSLGPGDWRFVVELPGVGFAEYDRDFALGSEPAPIQVRVLPEAELAAGRALLPAATLVLDEPRELGCTLSRREVRVASLWVSETAVSNAEYLAFLTETRRLPPQVWIDVGYPDGADTDHASAWRSLPGIDESFLELPATGMGYDAMQAYAEWAGLRLPTHHELEYIVRGDGMRRGLPAGAHVDGESRSLAVGPQARFAQYLAQVRGVRSGVAQPPHGLFHGYGNVLEMTSSKVSVLADMSRRLVTLHDNRISMGGAWDSRARSDVAQNHWLSHVSGTRAGAPVGFRCVRSAAPPQS